MKQRLHPIELTLMIVAALALTSGAVALHTQSQLAEKVVRLHVLANSDSEEDQALKLKVRDAVLEQATETLRGADSQAEASRRLTDILPELEETARVVITANGYDYGKHTCDDGLPATYGDFVKLCDYIVGAGVTPLIWSGENHADTLGKFMAQLAADFEGSEYALNFSFDGTATHLVKSVDASGNVTYKEPTKIQNSNGYELYSSAGRYYAVDFVEKILSKSNYHHDLAFNTTHSHMDAQDDFLSVSYTHLTLPTTERV